MLVTLSAHAATWPVVSSHTRPLSHNAVFLHAHAPGATSVSACCDVDIVDIAGHELRLSTMSMVLKRNTFGRAAEPTSNMHSPHDRLSTYRTAMPLCGCVSR